MGGHQENCKHPATNWTYLFLYLIYWTLNLIILDFQTLILMSSTDYSYESENPVLIISYLILSLSPVSKPVIVVLMESYKSQVTEKVQIFLFFWFWRDRRVKSVKVPHVMIGWDLHWFSVQDRFLQHSTFHWDYSQSFIASAAFIQTIFYWEPCPAWWRGPSCRWLKGRGGQHI